MMVKARKNFVLSDAEYEAVHDQDVEEVAAARGCYVWDSDDKMLQLDIDSEADLEFALMQIERMQAHDVYQVREVQVLLSQNDRWHIVVFLWESVEVQERIALQAAMGSDRVRELLNLIRIRKGVKNPVRLFRPIGTQVPEVTPTRNVSADPDDLPF
jgi:hypothetical protein